MSPVDLFAALTGISGAAPAQPKGAATAGADFLSALAALQGDGGPLKGQGDNVDPETASAPAHDLKGELLSGAALFMAPAAPVTPVQLSAAALAAANAEADAEADQPLPGAQNNQTASGESGDEAAPAVPNRGGAVAPASGAEPSAAQTRAQAALDQPPQTERQTPAGEARPANGEAQPDAKSAMAAAATAKAAEAALAARSPQSPAMPVPVPAPAIPEAKAQTQAAAAAAVDAENTQAAETAAARVAATAAGQASTTAADGKTATQPPATGETAVQVRQMARSQGETEADTRRDGRQERMAPAQSRLTGEASASATPASPGSTAATAPATTPSTTSPAAFAAPVAPAEAPAPEILPVAPEPLPADTMETSAEAETVRLQEAAAARTTATGSQLSRATVETTALIASQIIRRLDGRATRFDMALTPAGLGRVDVRVEIDSDGRLAARLAFDNPAAATDLRGRADELRRELQEAGFQLAEDALDFSDREQGSARHAFEREDRAFRGAGRLAAEADEAVIPPAPGRWSSLTMTPEGVDMKV